MVSEGKGFAIPEPHHGGGSLSLAELGERLESVGFGHYPEIEEPSNEEWITIIKEELEVKDLGTDHDMKVHGNQTGYYNTTEGVKSSWVSDSSANYHYEDEKLIYTSTSVQSINMDHIHFVSGTKSVMLYIQMTDNITSANGLTLGASFVIVKNGTYKHIGSSVASEERVYLKTSENTNMYEQKIIQWSQSLDHFAVMGMLAEGMVEYGRDKGYVFGEATGQSIPLNGEENKRMPKDPVDLARMLKASSQTDTLSYTTFSGDFTLGKMGKYDIIGNTIVGDESKPLYNSTTDLQGVYWLVDSASTGQQVSVVDLMGLVTGLFR